MNVLFHVIKNPPLTLSGCCFFNITVPKNTNLVRGICKHHINSYMYYTAYLASFQA